MDGVVPSLHIPTTSLTIRPKQRRRIMKTLRESNQTARSRTLLQKPDQGRAMECVAVHPASTLFIRNGDYTRFADWRFIHRARLNLVHLNGSVSWRAGDRRCRRCGYQIESLAHVADHCMRYSALYLARYNAIVARIKAASTKKFDTIRENQAIGSYGLRPDLVLARKSDKKLFIIDVTVPFDNTL